MNYEDILEIQANMERYPSDDFEPDVEGTKVLYPTYYIEFENLLVSWGKSL